MLQKVKDIYSESIQIQISASSLLSENIATATQMVMQCLLSGHKAVSYTHLYCAWIRNDGIDILFKQWPH